LIKPVTFKNQGQQLIGILHVPDRLKHGEKAPGIVMFHGFTANKTHRLLVHVARNLCDSGYVVFRFDFRGSGESDGEFEDMTVLGEVSDAEKALTFLTKQRLVDKEKLGVIGHSLGGRVAAILASRDKRVKFVVLYSPGLGPLEKMFRSQIDKEAMEKMDSGEAVKISSVYLRKPFFNTLDDPVPLDVMSKIKAPILIIHGDKDEHLSTDGSRKGYEIVKNLNDKNEFYVVKGGNHSFSERVHALEVIKKTQEWLVSLGLDKD